MKCGSCSVEIKPEFSHARKVNVCPSCGNQIMAPERVELFNTLKELVSAAYADLDLTGPVCLDFGELEVKPMPKHEPQAQKQTKQAEEALDPDSDESYKRNQMANAKDELKRLREEAYTEAMASQWGMDVGEEMVSSGTNPGQVLIDQKQQIARDRIVNGSGGKNSFRRS
jgi:DNA-directed RNA polymerase subunit RPC12/RpoP